MPIVDFTRLVPDRRVAAHPVSSYARSLYRLFRRWPPTVCPHAVASRSGVSWEQRIVWLFTSRGDSCYAAELLRRVASRNETVPRICRCGHADRWLLRTTDFGFPARRGRPRLPAGRRTCTGKRRQMHWSPGSPIRGPAQASVVFPSPIRGLNSLPLVLAKEKTFVLGTSHDLEELAKPGSRRKARHEQSRA